MLFDIIRIDHFRAFDTYWKIPASCPTAEIGEWVEAPGYAFFDRVREALPGATIVAEDLGDLRPEVHALRDHYGLMGMKIVQFCIQPGQPIARTTDEKENTVIYTGTHDNETLIQWCEGLDAECDAYAREYLGISAADDLADAIIEAGMQSRAQLFIMQMQDYLRLGKEARMNEPGRLLPSNWRWRMLPGAANDALAAKIAGLTARANRV